MSKEEILLKEYYEKYYKSYLEDDFEKLDKKFKDTLSKYPGFIKFLAGKK